MGFDISSPVSGNHGPRSGPCPGPTNLALLPLLGYLTQFRLAPLGVSSSRKKRLMAITAHAFVGLPVVARDPMHHDPLLSRLALHCSLTFAAWHSHFSHQPAFGRAEKNISWQWLQMRWYFFLSWLGIRIRTSPTGHRPPPRSNEDCPAKKA